MANKMTKMDWFKAIGNLEAVKANPGMVDFINHEMDLLTRKNSGEKKQTKTQMENEVLKVEILNGMEADTVYTVSDMIKTIPALNELSNQKVSAVANGMVRDGTLVKTTEKRKTYFHKA